MYLDQYVIASIVLVAVMIVAGFWAVRKVKQLVEKDAAIAAKK